MKELIEALQILAKYTDHSQPIRCEDGCFIVDGATTVDTADYDRLVDLGFWYDATIEGWRSFRFGSFNAKVGAAEA